MTTGIRIKHCVWNAILITRMDLRFPTRHTFSMYGHVRKECNSYEPYMRKSVPLFHRRNKSPFLQQLVPGKLTFLSTFFKTSSLKQPLPPPSKPLTTHCSSSSFLIPPCVEIGNLSHSRKKRRKLTEIFKPFLPRTKEINEEQTNANDV